MNYIFYLIGEISFLSIAATMIVFLQVYSAIKTYRKITILKHSFPSIGKFSVVNGRVPSEILKDEQMVNDLARKPKILSTGQKNNDNSKRVDAKMVDIPLIALEEADQYEGMSSIVYRTNYYVCKNFGNSPDFQQIKDICERHINAIDAEIRISLYTPLFLGLVGTFLGIISGLGFDTTDPAVTEGSNYLSSQLGLFEDVKAAISVSLMGLLLTIANSSLFYRKAFSAATSGKNDYYDFLERELMPSLTSGMLSTVDSLERVLGQFVDSFGGNLDTYTDTIKSLKESIDTQHNVVVELNKLDLTDTAGKMAESFKSLEAASESLDAFKEYQTGLADIMKKASDAAVQIDSVLSKFDDFGSSLKIIADNQTKTIQLETEFKNAIESHFPTGSVGREIWQKSFDELMADAQEVNQQLNAQLTASTQLISNFVNNNMNIFSSFQQLKDFLEQIVNYQAKWNQNLQEEMSSIRKDNKNIQLEIEELSKSILEAVKAIK